MVVMRHRGMTSVTMRWVIGVGTLLVVFLGVWAARESVHVTATREYVRRTTARAVRSGSDDVAVFRSLPIGAGGFVTDLAISDDGRTRIAAADTYGAYRWSDQAWRPLLTVAGLTDGPLDIGHRNGVAAVAVAPSDGRRAYMVTKDGVYRSTDEARTWSMVLRGGGIEPNDEYRTWGDRIAVDPEDADIVYVGTQASGLWWSLDGGDTWSKAPEAQLPSGATRRWRDRAVSRTAGISAVAVDPSTLASDGRYAAVYAAPHGAGIYRSSDGARTWTSIGPPGARSTKSLRVAANGDVFAVVLCGRDEYDPRSDTCIWRLRNDAWTQVTPPDDERYHGVAVSPATPARVAAIAHGGALRMSDDAGASWGPELARQARSDEDVPWLAWVMNAGAWISPGEILFDPVRRDRLWLADGTGVWHADIEPNALSVTWTSQSRGIEQLVATDVIVPPGGVPVVSAWDRPIFVVDEPDAYPQRYGPTRTFGTAWSLDWSAFDTDVLVASVTDQDLGPQRSGWSDDGGATWYPFPTIPLGSTDAETQFGFGAMAIGRPDNIVWVPAYGHEPHVTFDRGLSWKPVTLPTGVDATSFHEGPHFLSRSVIAADRVDHETFYMFGTGAGLFRSTDGGETWSLASPAGPWDGVDTRWHAKLEAVPQRAGHLFFTSGPLTDESGAVREDTPFLQSTDGGTTWEADDQLFSVSAFGFGRSRSAGGYPTIFAVGYGCGGYGAYYSTDGAASWRLIEGYPAGRFDVVREVTGDPDQYGRVYIAFGGSGWAWADVGQRTGSLSHDE